MIEPPIGQPRLCLEPGCDKPLEPDQRKFCSDRHAAAFRQRKHRRRRAEARTLVPPALEPVDVLLLRVVDEDDIAEYILDLQERRDDEIVDYCGVRVARIVAECHAETTRLCNISAARLIA